MPEGGAMVSGVPGRYATALFSLAEEAGALDAISSDVRQLRELLGGASALLDALDNPSYTRAEMAGVVAAVGEKLGLGGTTMKFLGLMAAKRRLNVLPQTLAAFETLAADKRGETTVEVTVAHALTEDQTEALKSKLAAASGGTVHMQVDVDPELLGGLVVKLGSKMIDASLRSQLSTLQHAMKEAG